jgi:hypothetical protein
MNRLILIAALLGLFGCATPQERMAKLARACQGYGFTQGTTEFAQCMQLEAAKRDAAADRAIQNSIMINQSLQPQQPVPAQQPYQGTRTFIQNGRTVVCTTTGTITNCI